MIGTMTPCDLCYYYEIAAAHDILCDPRIQDLVGIEVGLGASLSVRYANKQAHAHVVLLGLNEEIERWVEVINEYHMDQMAERRERYE